MKRAKSLLGRRRQGLPRLPWVLLGLLAVASGVIFLGERENMTRPDSNAYSPSGTRAFRTLLERNGFRTRSTRSMVQPLPADELVVAFYFLDGTPNFAYPDWNAGATGEMLKRHFRNGGRALILSLPRNFRYATEHKTDSAIQPAFEADDLVVSLGSDSEWTYSSADGGDKDQVLYTLQDEPFLWVDKVERGAALTVQNAFGATNRFLDVADNAETMLQAAQMAAGGRTNAVFLEASYGNVSEPALVETIGPWATGAWWQLNLLFVTLILALGIRFGPPADRRLRQRGSRDIADAMRDTYQRVGATDVAMQAILEEADRAIRRRLKLAIDTPKETRDRMLPDDLVEALRHAENAARNRAPISAVLPIARRLDHEVARFLGQHDRRAARRRP